MGKLLTVPAIAVLVVLGCSKRDDPAPDPALLGTWILYSTAYTGCTDTSLNIPEEVCPKLSCTTLNFTATTWASSTGDSGHYSITGNNITFYPSTIGTGVTSQYTITSTTLTFVRKSSPSLGCESVEVYTRQ